jgi:hypothetical protein
MEIRKDGKRRWLEIWLEVWLEIWFDISAIALELEEGGKG